MQKRILDWCDYRINAEDEHGRPVVLRLRLKHEGNDREQAMEAALVVSCSVEGDEGGDR